MVTDRGRGHKELLEPFTKSSCRLPYAFLITTYLVILVPVDYSTFLSDIIPIIGGHQEILDGVASFEMYPDPYIIMNILIAFAKPLDVWDHHVNVPVVAVAVGWMVVIPVLA